jgi:hypothetical protein
VNSPNLADYYLREKANAFELDVAFGPNGDILFAGKLEQKDCDCGLGCMHKTPIEIMLKYISSLVNTQSPIYNSQLVLLYTVPIGLDNASPQVMATAGRNLFLAINKWLYENGNSSIYIYLVNGIGKLKYEPYVIGFERAEEENPQLDQFYESRVGWDFWDTTMVDLCEVQRMWTRVGIIKGMPKIWQSNGRSICDVDCSPPLNKSDVSRALAAKSVFDVVSKAGIWTLSHERDIIYALNNGFDHMETTETRLTWQLINTEPWNQCYRMATWNDNPWTQVNPVPKCQVTPAPAYGSSYTSNSYASQPSICGVPIQSYPPIPSYSPYVSSPVYSSYMPSHSYPVSSYSANNPY